MNNLLDEEKFANLAKGCSWKNFSQSEDVGVCSAFPFSSSKKLLKIKIFLRYFVYGASLH